MNVRPSPAPVTIVNTGYPLGGTTVPSTAPLAVAPTTVGPGVFTGRATKYGGTLAIRDAAATSPPGPVGPSWIAPEMASDVVITAAVATAEAPARPARRQRRRARPRRRANWGSTREATGSPASSVNSSRIWGSVIAGTSSGHVSGGVGGLAAGTAVVPWPDRPPHRLQGPGGLALHRPP